MTSRIVTRTLTNLLPKTCLPATRASEALQSKPSKSVQNRSREAFPHPQHPPASPAEASRADIKKHTKIIMQNHATPCKIKQNHVTFFQRKPCRNKPTICTDPENARPTKKNWDGGARAPEANGPVVLNLRRGPGLLLRADGQLTRRACGPQQELRLLLICKGPTTTSCCATGRRSLCGHNKYYEYLVHVPVSIRGRRRGLPSSYKVEDAGVVQPEVQHGTTAEVPARNTLAFSPAGPAYAPPCWCRRKGIFKEHQFIGRTSTDKKKTSRKTLQ